MGMAASHQRRHCAQLPFPTPPRPPRAVLHTAASPTTSSKFSMSHRLCDESSVFSFFSSGAALSTSPSSPSRLPLPVFPSSSPSLPLQHMWKLSPVDLCELARNSVIQRWESDGGEGVQQEGIRATGKKNNREARQAIFPFVVKKIEICVRYHRERLFGLQGRKRKVRFFALEKRRRCSKFQKVASPPQTATFWYLHLGSRKMMRLWVGHFKQIPFFLFLFSVWLNLLESHRFFLFLSCDHLAAPPMPPHKTSCENLGLCSGWEIQFKEHWLGASYQLPGSYGNCIRQTNLCSIRAQYRLVNFVLRADKSWRGGARGDVTRGSWSRVVMSGGDVGW